MIWIDLALLETFLPSISAWKSRSPFMTLSCGRELMCFADRNLADRMHSDRGIQPAVFLKGLLPEPLRPYFR